MMGGLSERARERVERGSVSSDEMESLPSYRSTETGVARAARQAAGAPLASVARAQTAEAQRSEEAGGGD
eukprot:2714962-Alexandrium_andersonii.AAC.1